MERSNSERKAVFSIVLTVVLVWFALAEAQQLIFLVRHGETVAPKGTDLRPLSEAGQRVPCCSRPYSRTLTSM
jgi:hypothetical protein